MHTLKRFLFIPMMFCCVLGAQHAVAQSSFSVSNSSNDTLVHVKNDGKVGIGTTSPSQKLDVLGIVKMTGFNLSTTPSAGYVLTADGSGTGTWQAPSGTVGGTGTLNYLAKFNGTSTVTSSAVFESGGNVGIGTASPVALLTVGTANAFQVNASGQVVTTGDITSQTSVASGSGEFFARNTSGGAAVDIRAFGTAAGGTQFGVSQTNSARVVSYDGNTANFIVGTMGATPMIFGTNASERMRMDVAGNVGIGTTSPAGILDLISDASANPPVISDSRAYAQNVGGVLSFTGKSDAGGNRSTFAQIKGGKENGTSGDYAGYFGVSTRLNGSGSSSERMRITSAGNVGIGTTTPSEKLEVAGNIKIGNATIRSGTGSPQSIVTGNVGDLYLRTDGGAGTTMYVKESGNATNTGWMGK